MKTELGCINLVSVSKRYDVWCVCVSVCVCVCVCVEGGGGMGGKGGGGGGVEGGFEDSREALLGVWVQQEDRIEQVATDDGQTAREHGLQQLHEP